MSVRLGPSEADSEQVDVYVLIKVIGAYERQIALMESRITRLEQSCGVSVGWGRSEASECARGVSGKRG